MSFSSRAVPASVVVGFLALAACVRHVTPGPAVSEARAVTPFARIDARVEVDLPQLDGVTNEGSGDVFVDGASKRGAVDLVIQGSGDLHYAAAGAVLQCAVEGSGDLFLRGDGLGASYRGAHANEGVSPGT